MASSRSTFQACNTFRNHGADRWEKYIEQLDPKLALQAVMGTLPIAAACSAELQGRVFRVLVRMVERHAQMMHGQEILLDSIAPGLTELVRETKLVIRDGNEQKRTMKYFDGKIVMEKGTFNNLETGLELTSGNRTTRNPDGSTRKEKVKVDMAPPDITTAHSPVDLASPP